MLDGLKSIKEKKLKEEDDRIWNISRNELPGMKASYTRKMQKGGWPDELCLESIVSFNSPGQWQEGGKKFKRTEGRGYHKINVTGEGLK